MPFWVCYYHIVWATRNRELLIAASIEPVLFESIRSKSAELGCPILSVNGMSDHIHIAVSIPPKVAVAEWVGNVKGASSYTVNTMFPNAPTHFRWQSGYGVLTFGVKHLVMVQEYIANQKTHHANNTLLTYLERADD
jgi:REP element-mobilizing transposase RayT